MTTDKELKWLWWDLEDGETAVDHGRRAATGRRSSKILGLHEIVRHVRRHAIREPIRLVREPVREVVREGRKEATKKAKPKSQNQSNSNGRTAATSRRSKG